MARTMGSNAKISIAGHRGLVGSAIQRNLQAKGYSNFALPAHRQYSMLLENSHRQYSIIVE